MKPKCAMMIVVEGLSTSLLGCYGSPWCRTPNLDSFAAGSVIFDDCWLKSDSVSDSYDSMFISCGENWLARAERSGLESVLLTDRSDLADLASLDGFSKVLTLSDLLAGEHAKGALEDSSERPAVEDPSQCRTPVFLEKSIEYWLNHDPRSRPDIIWLHLSGWNGPWDAPLEIRESLRDEEDPPAIETNQPPSIRLTSEEDLEIRIPWVQAAAAQMMIFDQAWRYVDFAIQQIQSSTELAVVLAGLGGCPLGEHGVIGCEPDCIYAERVRVPLILRTGNESPIGYRIPHVTSLTDVGPALGTWILGGNDGSANIDFSSRPVTSVGNVVISENKNARSARAGNWCYVDVRTDAETAAQESGETQPVDGAIGDQHTGDQPPAFESNEEQTAQLFLMPEDQWQQNNVAARAGDTLTDMRHLTSKWKESSEIILTSELPDTIQG